MKPEDKIRNLINNSDVTTGSETDQRILGDALRDLEQQGQQRPVGTGSHVLRTIMKGTRGRLAVAAAAIVIVLGGIGLWPDGNGDQWWLGSPAVWGKEIVASLEKVTALTYRQRALRVMDYGPDTIGGLWEKRYAAKDKYRREVRDEANNIIQIQWTLPADDGFVKYQVWPKYRCYTQESEKTPPSYDGVMGWMQRWVRLAGKANRILGTRALEGRPCVGFEISPGMYEGFLVQVPVHIWLDVETKLPVNIERRGLPVDYDPTRKLTLIYDQFDYHAEVPTDMFSLQIPEGYVNSHRDDVIAARKGPMVYADANVPAKLRNEIVAALKGVETAVHEQHSEITVDGDLSVYPPHIIFLSKDSWREDSYGWKNRREKIEWYTIEKKGRQGTSLDFDEDNFRLTHTTVDFDDKAYSVVTYTKDDGFRQPRHPMANIMFLAGVVDRADRILENAKIEGFECFGVEISAGKYGETPASTKHRMWFDTKTKLPIRIETVRTEDSYQQENVTKKSVRVLERFVWNGELPDDTFKPTIPEGFTPADVNEP